MSYVSRPVRKKDAMALVTGKPVYTDDVTLYPFQFLFTG